MERINFVNNETRASAETFNTLQDNIENGINDATQKNIITARGSTINVTTTTDNQSQKLAINTLVNKVGDKLSYNSSTGEITIGEGVSYVKVSAGASLQYKSGSQTYHGVVILKNGIVFSNIIREVRSANLSSNNYSDSSLNNILIDVNQGDKISMGVYNRIAGSTDAIYPVLTVEVVD